LKIYLVTTRTGDLLIKAESKSKAIKACTSDIVARLATAEDILNNPELRVEDMYFSRSGPYTTHGEEQGQ
jgi:hypothetical protein